jgi:hypothetical protein
MLADLLHLDRVTQVKLEFLIKTFKQPIAPSCEREPNNPALSARRSELSLLATSTPLEAHAPGLATRSRPSVCR